MSATPPQLSLGVRPKWGKGVKILKRLALIMLAIIVVKVGATFVEQMTADSATRSNNSQSQKDASVVALVVKKDSKNVTKDQFDQDFLENLKRWMADQIVTKAKKHFIESGNNPNDFHEDIDSDAVYVKIQDKKLAIVRLTFNKQMRVAWIVGIEPPELVRVICIRRRNEEIPIFHGNCGSKVLEAFNITMPAGH